MGLDIAKKRWRKRIGMHQMTAHPVLPRDSRCNRPSCLSDCAVRSAALAAPWWIQIRARLGYSVPTIPHTNCPVCCGLPECHARLECEGYDAGASNDRPFDECVLTHWRIASTCRSLILCSERSGPLPVQVATVCIPTLLVTLPRHLHIPTNSPE
jgi:hypothetical protein